MRCSCCLICTIHVKYSLSELEGHLLRIGNFVIVVLCVCVGHCLFLLTPRIMVSKGGNLFHVCLAPCWGGAQENRLYCGERWSPNVKCLPLFNILHTPVLKTKGSKPSCGNPGSGIFTIIC